MTLNQAKTKVAQRLHKLGVEVDIIGAAIDATKENAIMEAATLLETEPEMELTKLQSLIYIPKI